MKYQPNQYYDFQQMTAVLHEFVRCFPHLIRLRSVGKSLEGRDLWAATVTDFCHGLPDEKPALYIDANIHAGEVCGTNVCLHTIWDLIQRFGHDESVQRLLQRRTFYVLPRINPDGAEAFLRTPSLQWGSSVPYPECVPTSGWERCDIDGNGEQLLIRFPHERGEWKCSDQDSRLMIPRQPDEYNGHFFRILPEGRIIGAADVEDFDVLPTANQLNLNRNFPAGWLPDAVQPGGGRYPLSEPESKAIVEFILSHPNIGALQTYHTAGGVILRPFSHLSDEAFAPEDRLIFERLGELGEAITGYDMVSIFEAFTPDKSQPRRGVLDDWAYNYRGIIAFGAELWNLAAQAGISRADQSNYYPLQDQGEPDELRMLAFNDHVLQGEGFSDWTPFEHEQMGPVEIGGWRPKYTMKNPPPRYLVEECERNVPLSLATAAMLPELVLAHTKVEPFEGGLTRVRVVVENDGYFPTSVTRQAVDMGVGDQVIFDLTPSDAWEIVSGSSEIRSKPIPGRMRFYRGFYFGDPAEGIPRRTRTAEWILRSRGQTECSVLGELTVSSERAGTIRTTVRLS